jgi:L-rhamnose mutarotase
LCTIGILRAKLLLPGRPFALDFAATMLRKAFRMSVHAGQELEYERRHRPIWPELERALLEHGVLTYSIFLEPSTGALFGYVEVESEERWAAIAATEVCRRWWSHMKELMPSNLDHSPVSVELREVFHIEAETAGDRRR